MDGSRWWPAIVTLAILASAAACAALHITPGM